MIELLVVVAIIGILASVVLGSLNAARSKGADAAVKANLSNIRAQGEIVYDATGLYATVCSVPAVIVAGVVAEVTANGNFFCNDNNSVWVASTALKSTNLVNGTYGTDFWCVDSTGISKLEDASLGGAFVCS